MVDVSFTEEVIADMVVHSAYTVLFGARVLLGVKAKYREYTTITSSANDVYTFCRSNIKSRIVRGVGLRKEAFLIVISLQR